MFERFDPHTIRNRLPVVLAAVGARRSGKSCALMNLVWRLFDHYAMVVAFVGSAACCPTLEAMMRSHPTWDERFFFDKWNQPLVDKLLAQQQDLGRAGVNRPVLIIMDDVILSGKAADQLSHMCMRGRHFNISVMMAAVSYTSISKRARRSLDYLLCFGCPMTGDRKVLSWEYAHNARLADFGLKRLELHQCLVFETGKNELRNWRAEHITPEMFRDGRRPPIFSALKKTSNAREIHSGSCRTVRTHNRCAVQSPENSRQEGGDEGPQMVHNTPDHQRRRSDSPIQS